MSCDVLNAELSKGMDSLKSEKKLIPLMRSMLN